MVRSVCVVDRFLLALDRRSGGFLPVSGSFWMNFFSTYLDLIHDSLSPLRHRNDRPQTQYERNMDRQRFALKASHARLCLSLFRTLLVLSLLLQLWDNMGLRLSVSFNEAVNLIRVLPVVTISYVPNINSV